MVTHNDGMVSFLSDHQLWVSAQANGTLVADRTIVGAWEKFTRIDNGDGSVSLRSAHGKYLVAESDGNMNANRNAIGPWEKFQLITSM